MSSRSIAHEQHLLVVEVVGAGRRVDFGQGKDSPRARLGGVDSGNLGIRGEEGQVELTGELEIVRPDHARADVCLLAATHVGDAAQAPRRVQEDRRNRQVRWEAVVVLGKDDFEVFLLAFAALDVEQVGIVLHHVARQRERRHVDHLDVRRCRPGEPRQLRVLAECKVMHAHALGLFARD